MLANAHSAAHYKPKQYPTKELFLEKILNKPHVFRILDVHTLSKASLHYDAQLLQTPFTLDPIEIDV